MSGSSPLGVATTETRRLQAIARYEASDESFEAAFDPIAALAAQSLQTPMAFCSIVEEFRIRLIGCYGFTGPRFLINESGLCASAVLQQVPYVVERADLDSRTRRHSLVAGRENVRFYVGVPLRTPNGHNVGTLAVLDRIARHADRELVEQLQTLATLAVDRLERRASAERLR
jgi:sigma-B regulation protein RsbU (phosphoserine phosphatase)